MTKKFADRSVLKPKEEMEVLLELASMGAGNAAATLSEILQQPILIEVPKIRALPPHLVLKFYKRHDRPTTAIYMPLSEEAECDVVLLFEAKEVKKVVAVMTNVLSPEEVDPEMKASAMKELGSLMICSFFNAVADFVGVRLVPEAAQLVIDSFDAIMDGFLVKQALVSDIALIFDTCFKGNSYSANGVMLMFPSRELQKLLVNKAKKWLDQDHSDTVTADQSC